MAFACGAPREKGQVFSAEKCFSLMSFFFQTQRFSFCRYIQLESLCAKYHTSKNMYVRTKTMPQII